MERPQVGRRRLTRGGKMKEKQIDTVMFVVHTPGDTLAKSLQKAEDKFVTVQWKHSAEHHNGREDVVYSMKVERSYAESPLNRQIDESTSIARSRAQIPMNSRSEWNSQRIPRIVLQVQGKDQLEDDEKMPSMETWTVQAPTVKVNINQERRKERPSEEGDEGQTKKRRVGDSTDLPGEGAAALGSATVKNSLQFRQEEVEEDRERPPLGEGDREEQRPRAVFPLPMRSPKAKAIKKPSKGKIKK